MLFIFDWDGTLSDSAAKIIACMHDGARQVGLPVLEDDAVRNIIGLGLPEAIRTLYSGIENEQVDLLRQAYAEAYLDHAESISPFFDGAQEAVEALLSGGHQLAVATGKSRKGLDRVLKDTGWHKYFHFSRCADETASKPHPLMLLELLQVSGASAEAAVMIGDTEFDMAMARQINMPRAAVSYGAHSPERLMPYEPVACTADLRELVDLFHR